MPRIGNVEVSDDVVAALGRTAAPAPARPGIGSIVAASARSTAGQLRYGVPLAVEKLAGTLDQNDAAFYAQGLRAAGEASAQAAPASFSDVTAGRVGLGRWVAENFAASVPQTAGTLVGAIGGGLLGGPVGAAAGAVAAGSPMFVGSNVARAVDEEGGLSSAAAARSIGVAPVQAASDALVDRFLPGAGRLFGGFAARQTGNFIQRTAKSMAKAGVTEAVTEAGQQLGERYAAGMNVTGADAAAEYANAAVTAFAVGGVLGVGGGFRRTSADIKPANQVTVDDLNEKIDAFIAGGMPQLGGPAPQLALPGPDQLSAVPPGNDLRRPDVFVDQAGRAGPSLADIDRAPVADVVVSPQGDALVAPTSADLTAFINQPVTEFDRWRDAMAGIAARGPAPVEPGINPLAPAIIEARRQQVPPALAAPGPAFDPATIDPRSSATSALAQRLATGDVTFDPPTVEVLGGRLFADATLDEIETARRAKNAEPVVREEADREIETRWQEAAGTVPLTTDDFQTRLGEVKSGLRNQFVVKLEATSPADLVDKVYTRIFEDQDTSATTAKLAQRVGLLDADLNPTPRATEIEAARTAQTQVEATPEVVTGTPVGIAPPAPPAPAAPAATTAPVAPPAPERVSITPAAPSPDFAAEWESLKDTAGIRRTRDALRGLNPANIEDARLQVFNALSTDSSDVEVSQVEKLARTMGLVTDDENMDITPLGHRTYLRTPDGQAEIADAAANARHDTGVFSGGVAAELEGTAAPSFNSFEDMAAHEAGRTWARSYMRSAGRMRSNAETSDFMGRIGGRRELTPGQVDQQALNNLVDAADLREVPDTEIAALRRMIRDGADAQTVGQALQQLQGGRVLFRQPDTTPTQLSPAPTRGQPIFKEIDVSEAPAPRAAQRAESEEAVRAFDLRNLIAFAQNEGGLTAVQAQRLHDLLDAGKIAQVESRLKAFDPDAAPAAPRAPRLPTPPERVDVPANETTIVPAADLAFEQAISDLSFMQTLDYMVTQAPSTYHREIMKRVRALAKAIEKTTPMRFELRIVKPGDQVPAALNNPGLRALARIERNPPVGTVWLKSTDMGGSSGTNFQLAMHEMLHIVTMDMLQAGNTKRFSGTRFAKPVGDLIDLRNEIIRHFNARAAAGTLNEFERRYFNRTNNTLQDADEVLAWGLTNPEMQRYLQSIEYKPRQSVFGRLVELLRNLLGLEGRYDTALTELLRVSEKIMGTRGAELQAVFGRNDPDLGQDTTLEAPAREISAASRTVQASSDALRSTIPQIATAIERVTDNVPLEDFKVKARRVVLGWRSMNSIVRGYADRMPALNDLVAAKRRKDAVHGRFAALGDQVQQSTEQFRQANPKGYAKMMELMAASTRLKLDPERAFNDHTHLGFSIDAAGQRVVPPSKAAEIARLAKSHADIVKMRNDLSRGDGQGYRLYQEIRASNELQNLAYMTADLHRLVSTDPEFSLGVAGAGVNPMDTFLDQELATTDEIRAFWDQALQQQIAAATAFIRRKMGEAAVGTPSEQRGMQQHLSPIEEKVRSIHENIAAMRRAPYFHLGRFGENFGSAVIRSNKDGTADVEALRHVAEQLEKAGFYDAELAEDITRPRFSMRFETVDQTRQFERLMLKLQAEGWLEPDTIKAGPLSRPDIFNAAQEMTPGLVHRYIDEIRNSPTYVPEPGMSDAEKLELSRRKDEALRLAMDSWIAMQPNNSIAKVLTARQTVGGYDPNMMRSYAHRTSVGARALANISTSPSMSKAYADMRSQVLEANDASNPDDPQMLADLLTEMKRRDAIAPSENTNTGFIDRLRAYGHAYFLGFSPAYGAIQLMQIGTNAIPELAKQHGYQRSFHAIRRATPKAIAILKAVNAEARAQGWKHAADMTLTENALQKAGLSKSDTDFVRRMIATGSLDIGSSAHALGEIARGNTGRATDVALKYAASIGLYTETASRLMTSLAAHELHGGQAVESADYAQQVVSEALFDYQNWNRARQLGKQGFAGPVTPLLTQFMTFSAQMTEKLFSEFHSAVTAARPGESAAAAAERQRQSRSFLLGHMTAITGLAGSLGLPFASVFATAIERLVDGLGGDDEPYDATASWRNFLAGIFGKDVAEVLSRGLPRAAGFDISARVGEADLLPFTQLLTDRRSWKESVSAALGRASGASPDMLMSILDGGSQFSNGDVLGGLKAMMPVAFKGPTEAFRMSSEGYVDTKGNRLPISPKASSILWQLLGFNPAEKAEYSEARGDQQSRRVGINQRGNRLRQQIVRALISGDQAGAAELIAEAQEFDTANPAFAVIPSLPGALERQQSSTARALALQTPVGVSFDDLAGQALTGYANTNYR